MAEKIRLYTGDNKLVYDDLVRDVNVGPQEFITGNLLKITYKFAPISRFSGPEGDLDGGIFHLPPLSMSNIAAITKEGFTCEDVVHAGMGVIVVGNERGTQRYDLDGREPRVIRYGYGDVVVYAAGLTPFSLIGIYNPPYEGSFEEVAEEFGQPTIGGVRVPLDFWREVSLAQAAIGLADL